MPLGARAPRVLRIVIVIALVSFSVSFLYARMTLIQFEPAGESVVKNLLPDGPIKQLNAAVRNYESESRMEMDNFHSSDKIDRHDVDEGLPGDIETAPGIENDDDTPEYEDDNAAAGGNQPKIARSDRVVPPSNLSIAEYRKIINPAVTNENNEHEDLSDSEDYNLSHQERHANTTNTKPKTSSSGQKDRWDLTGLKKEIITIDGHQIILHHGSNFYILDKYPVTDDPYNYLLDEKRKIKLCTQKERAEFMHQKCKENNWPRWDEMPEDQFRTEELPNLLVDDKHQVMFCQSLKKSSTNKWIKFFGIATGKVDDMKRVPIHHMENVGLKGLREYPPNEIKEKLKTYTKLIVVRHPYRRLANLWDDDFQVEGTATRWRLGPQLIEKFHGKGSYTHGDMLSFEDYIRYTLGELGEPESYYGIRNFDACKPCLVGYDFIRRIETGPLDSEDLLKKMEIYEHPAIRDAEQHHGLRALVTSLSPVEELPDDLRNKLHAEYKPDLDIFGYTYKNGRAGCEIRRSDGSICC